MMKVLKITPQKTLTLSEEPIPAPRAGEVLIRTAFAGVNRADLMQVAGDYPSPPGWPDRPGLEISGTVEKTGAGTSRFKPGDRVCALLGGGGYAGYSVAPEEMVMPIPENLSFSQAAAIPETYATGWLNLFIEAKIKKGETLLVTGGTSGLASAVIPMAKAFGIRVLTSVRSEKKARQIANLGADRVIDTSETPLPAALKEEEEKGSPVNAALDCVGGEDVGKCLPYLAKGARWIMIAALAGTKTEVDLKTVYVRNVRIIGSTLRSRTSEVKGEILRSLEREVFPLFDNGTLKPALFAEMPLESANEAHELLRSGSRTGKVVLRVE